MTPLILLAVIAGLPVVLAILFRVNAIFLFLSLAVGELLVKYLSDDISFTLSTVIHNQKVPMVSQLCLLLLPVALTLLLLRKTMPASKFLLHIVPLALTGLSVAVLTVPLLSGPTQAQVYSTQIGNTLRQAQDVIIGAAGILTLLLAWYSHRHHPDKHGKHHHGR